MAASALHKNLKILRELNSLTQAEVDIALGLKKGVYSAYEGSTTPRLPILLKLLNFYRISSPVDLSVEILAEEDLSYLKKLKYYKSEITDTVHKEDSDSNELEEIGPGGEKNEQPEIEHIMSTALSSDSHLLERIFTIPEMKEYFVKELIKSIKSSERQDQ